jgi:hypothetical protein
VISWLSHFDSNFEEKPQRNHFAKPRPLGMHLIRLVMLIIAFLLLSRETMGIMA